jgi:hypothetical protein
LRFGHLTGLSLGHLEKIGLHKALSSLQVLSGQRIGEFSGQYA